MEERSLRVVATDKTFFNKLTNTLTKFLIPTQIGFNSLKISMKRNVLIKTYETLNAENAPVEKKEELEKRYDDAYTAYLEALDKYVLDTIYKKVKNETATQFESTALSQYYGIVQLKDREYNEYKYRKQKYLLELDNESVKNTAKEKVIEKYNRFYVSKQDSLYKGILKNYSIKLADSTNIYDSSKDWIYVKIFNTLEDYMKNILPLKISDPKLESVSKDYEKYEKFSVGKLDTRDNIEKNMILLGISRNLFTHSLPLVVAEQCYMKLLKDARCLVQDTKIAAKREKAYTMVLNLIEDYNIRLLSTKVYWDNSKEREEFKKFYEQYKQIEKLKEVDFIKYVKEKEILFIKTDLKKIRNDKTDYSRLIKYYKRKLVDYGVMKEIRKAKKRKKMYQLEYLDLEENNTYEEIIKKVVEQCFKEEKLEQSKLYVSITLTTPDNIHKINKQYRDVDRETDVLSFPMFEKEELENKINSQDFEYEDVLGDIIISIDRVKEQAEEYGHSFEREFAYMIVHGFYHLMGYDHIKEEDKAIMRPKEEKVLNKLGITREDMNE